MSSLPGDLHGLKPTLLTRTARRPWAFERGRFWAVELGSQALPGAAIRPKIAAELGELPSELAGPLASAMGFSSPHPVQMRLASGRRCFAARVEGEIAAYCWVSQACECVGEIERELQIPPGEIYIWDCATLPAYRQNHLYAALLQTILVQLQAERMQRAWIGSNLDNLASIRAFIRAGFQPVMTLTYARLFGMGGGVLRNHPTAAPAQTAAIQRMMHTAQDVALGPFLLRYSRRVQPLPCTSMEN